MLTVPHPLRHTHKHTHTHRGHRRSPLLTHLILVQALCQQSRRHSCSLWRLVAIAIFKSSFHNSVNATSVEAYHTDVNCFPAILAKTMVSVAITLFGSQSARRTACLCNLAVLLATTAGLNCADAYGSIQTACSITLCLQKYSITRNHNTKSTN
jgi:hypothetical protein